MPKERNFKDNILLVIKGMAMGTANKIPGVSGGIVAFVVGFYEEFIYSLQKVNRKAFSLLFQRGLKSFLQYTNAQFLGFLVLGMLISFFSVSKILDYFMELNETRVWALFFGMIIGSLYYVLKEFKGWNVVTLVTCIIGLLVGGFISFLNPAQENTNLIFIFFCGVISVSGMALPGLSGSFILILMGNYVLLLVDSVNALYDVFSDIIRMDFGFIHDPDRIRMLVILAIFTLGSVVGTIFFSQLLSYLLKKYHDIIIAIIIGFITGSLGVVWPWKNNNYKEDSIGRFVIDSEGHKVITSYNRFIPNFGDYQVWITILFVILGVLIVLILEWYGSKQKK